MGKPTPGPWEVNPFSAQVDCQRLSRKGGLLPIAQLLWPTDERSEAETEANAALIAAAPDLLAALQGMVKAFDDTVLGFKEPLPPVAAARAAITRALPNPDTEGATS